MFCLFNAHHNLVKLNWCAGGVWRCNWCRLHRWYMTLFLGIGGQLHVYISRWRDAVTSTLIMLHTEKGKINIKSIFWNKIVLNLKIRSKFIYLKLYSHIFKYLGQIKLKRIIHWSCIIRPHQDLFLFKSILIMPMTSYSKRNWYFKAFDI